MIYSDSSRKDWRKKAINLHTWSESLCLYQRWHCWKAILLQVVMRLEIIYSHHNLEYLHPVLVSLWILFLQRSMVTHHVGICYFLSFGMYILSIKIMVLFPFTSLTPCDDISSSLDRDSLHVIVSSSNRESITFPYLLGQNFLWW